MNLNKLKEVLDSETLDDTSKTSVILEIISEDKNAIPYLLGILKFERDGNRQLLQDMNVELSRADVHIQNPSIGGRSTNKEMAIKEAREFVLNNITAFYVKYKHKITHCFNKQV